MNEDRRIASAELPSTLRQIAERTWASFSFDPARLLQHLPGILGRGPRDGEYFLIYLADAGNIFPGQTLGYGAVPADAPKELVLLTAAFEVYQELQGTHGPEVRAFEALEKLSEALDPFERGGLDAVRACIMRPPPAGNIRVRLPTGCPFDAGRCLRCLHRTGTEPRRCSARTCQRDVPLATPQRPRSRSSE